MCLTAEPRVNRRGLKGMLLSCKLLQGRLQARTLHLSITGSIQLKFGQHCFLLCQTHKSACRYYHDSMPALMLC